MQRGFTYLGLLFLIALLSLTAAMASVVWSTVQQRADERELVFAGQQFQRAIERYRHRSLGPDNLYPKALEDLLRDARAPQVERHLRRVYVDPMTGKPQWGVIREPKGGIVGVHSLSERKPMQGTTWAAPLGITDGARSYQEWRFVAPSAAAASATSSMNCHLAPEQCAVRLVAATPPAPDVLPF